MVKVIGPKDPKDPNAINTTSRSKNWSQGLSPFYLGPIKLYKDYESKNFENAWQFAKVYKQHVDANQDPTEEYFKWAKEGWESDRAFRYPMGKGKAPLYSYWDGEHLSYVEARKQIYVPLYAEAVQKTSAFQQLKQIYSALGEVTLWDFDGYDHRAAKMTYEEVVNDPKRKCGHAFVLAMMLEGVL